MANKNAPNNKSNKNIKNIPGVNKQSAQGNITRSHTLHPNRTGKK